MVRVRDCAFFWGGLLGLVKACEEEGCADGAPWSLVLGLPCVALGRAVFPSGAVVRVFSSPGSDLLGETSGGRSLKKGRGEDFLFHFTGPCRVTGVVQLRAPLAPPDGDP